MTELDVALPGLVFPLDVTGGVTRFRHRRGVLRRLSLELEWLPLASALSPRLRGLLGERAPEIRLARRGPRSVSVEIVQPAARPEEEPRILVFTLAASASGGELRLFAGEARGSNLPGPAPALAIAATAGALGSDALREGSRFRFSSLPRRICRALLPDAGARVPDTGELGPRTLVVDERGAALIFEDGAGFLGDEIATRADEAASLALAADEALRQGDAHGARSELLIALERAPRHPEIARRIIEIDAHAGARGEAAMAMVREVERIAPLSLGATAAQLLVEIGDRDGAIARLVREAEREPAPTLRAGLYARAAALVADPLDALLWLDSAVEDAPRQPFLRWQRLERNLEAGRFEAAMADVGELEAFSGSPSDKCAVFARAGERFRAHRYATRAAPLFERALRYAPDDPVALAGLGEAMAADGRAARAATLLAYAVELAVAQGSPSASYELSLARTLAEGLGDRSSAIARARQIPSAAPESSLARALEGRWRAELGDAAGASVAFARLREEACSGEHSVLLVEAARFEDEVRGDLPASERHLARALSLSPRDARIESSLRAVRERSMQRERRPELEAPAPLQALPEEIASESPGNTSMRLVLGVEEPDEDPDEAVLSARVEDLTRKLQADPDDDSVVDELVSLLRRLGRGLELLALLSARLEDAPEERRPTLVVHQREVLEVLAHDAREAGRNEEADLFVMAREALD